MDLGPKEGYLYYKGLGSHGYHLDPQAVMGCWEWKNGFKSHEEAVCHKELGNHRHSMDPKTHLGTQESGDPEARECWLL